MISLKQAHHSDTLKVHELSNQLEKDNKQIFRFGFGQSPFMPPQFVQDAVKNNVHQKQYLPVQGMPELREAVSRFFKQLHGISSTANNVYIGPGSKQLIFNVIFAFKKAIVYLPQPSWVSYGPQAELCGHKTVRVTTDFNKRGRMDPTTLDTLLTANQTPDAQAILILNSPGNPDGQIYTKSELEVLVPVFRKHNVLVVSDEIYAPLCFEDSFTSLSTLYPENTIVTSGLSKWCGAGGWRVGTAIIPDSLGKDFHQTFLGMASETYSCVASPLQFAAVEAFQYTPEILNYIERQKTVLKKINQFVSQTLNGAGIQTHPGQGGFYVTPNFETYREKLAQKGVQTSQDVCAALMSATGVVLLPGTAFGFTPDQLVARLAYVDFDGKTYCENPEGALETFAPKVVEGIKRMGSWAESL